MARSKRGGGALTALLAAVISAVLYLGFFWLPVAAIGLALSFPSLFLPPLVVYSVFVLASRVEYGKGRPWPAFSRSFPLWPMMRDYFPLELHLPESLSSEAMEAGQQFIFGLHPHGACTDYRILADGILYDKFPKLGGRWRTLAATVLFRIPLVREFSLWTSGVDASRPSAQRVLRKGHSVLVVPGGEKEQLMTEYGKEQLYLQRRLGFVKLAIEHQAPLVPVYVFGTNDLYRTSRFLYSARKWLVEKFHICIPLFYGRMGLMAPYQVPLDMVFGDPISVPSNDGKGKNGAPSREQVAELHGKYVEALVRLFDDNKARFGYGDRSLVIK